MVILFIEPVHSPGIIALLPALTAKLSPPVFASPI